MRTIAALLAGVSPSSFAAVAFALSLLLAGSSEAGVFGPKDDFREARPTADWNQSRVVLGGALALPASFAGGWGTAFGWSAGFLDPVAEYCDIVIDAEGFTFRYDASDLRARGAMVAPVSHADFFDLGIGVHLHLPATGRRLYGLVEVALPDVSRPQVRWTDASGDHVQEGSEIFGFDPGWVIGFGIDQADPRRLGGLAETRFVIAPGHTRNTEYMVSFRAGLTVPLPAW